jgi:hypothetical protein
MDFLGRYRCVLDCQKVAGQLGVSLPCQREKIGKNGIKLV